MSTNTDLTKTNVDVWQKTPSSTLTSEALIPKSETEQTTVMKSGDPENVETGRTISYHEYSQLKNARVQQGQNRFTSHRNFIYQRIDIALILANCYQIRIIISEGHRNEYYHVLLGFALCSICSQCLLALMMVISWQADKKSINAQGGIKKAESIVGKICQFIAILLVLITIISNIVVVEFGALTEHDKEMMFTVMNITGTRD